MKEIRIDKTEIRSWPIGYEEFFLRLSLRAAGIDIKKTVIRFDDYPNNKIVFQQNEEDTDVRPR